MSILHRIAIIGAGAAGLNCARLLAAGGHAVTVFDKSGDIGGRLATRRRSDGSWNHGAPAADVHSDSGRRALQSLLDAGSARAFGDRFLGAPDMRELLRPWLERIELRSLQTVVGLEHSAQGWRLQANDTRDTDGSVTVAGPFDAVVCAIPAPQAETLLGNSQLPVPSALSSVAFDPCWTLLLTLAPSAVGTTPSSDTADPLRAVLANNLHAPNQRRFVAHAAVPWSVANLEWQPQQVVDTLLPAAAAALQIELAQVATCKAHRWRFAQVAQPLGQACIWQAPTRLALVGDWCLGATVDAALRSGAAAAAAIAGEGS